MSAEPIHLANHTPFDLHAELIEDLFMEAKNFADGQPIETQAQADAVQSLMRQIQQAEKGADDERKKENEPHDTAKAAVQARYAPLIGNTTKLKGKTILAVECLKACLAPWLKRLDDEQRAAALAAREEAEKAARLAAEASRSSDLAAREEAEALVTAARKAQAVAKAAETSRPQATGMGRAATLRSTWKAVLTDSHVAAGHFWKVNPAAFDALLQKLADDEVRSGKRTIPGFDVIEERSVV